ncbi:hypothetical protein KAR91_47020 [Candidatus Pacearchaeota archaeon]|nr:hypothetical protein [Candidatus Pacearchaeota archaeon]
MLRYTKTDVETITRQILEAYKKKDIDGTTTPIINYMTFSQGIEISLHAIRKIDFSQFKKEHFHVLKQDIDKISKYVTFRKDCQIIDDIKPFQFEITQSIFDVAFTKRFGEYAPASCAIGFLLIACYHHSVENYGGCHLYSKHALQFTIMACTDEKAVEILELAFSIMNENVKRIEADPVLKQIGEFNRNEKQRIILENAKMTGKMN